MDLSLDCLIDATEQLKKKKFGIFSYIGNAFVEESHFINVYRKFSYTVDLFKDWHNCFRSCFSAKQGNFFLYSEKKPRICYDFINFSNIKKIADLGSFAAWPPECQSKSLQFLPAAFNDVKFLIQDLRSVYSEMQPSVSLEYEKANKFYLFNMINYLYYQAVTTQNDLIASDTDTLFETQKNNLMRVWPI